MINDYELLPPTLKAMRSNRTGRTTKSRKALRFAGFGMQPGARAFFAGCFGCVRKRPAARSRAIRMPIDGGGPPDRPKGVARLPRKPARRKNPVRHATQGLW